MVKKTSGDKITTSMVISLVLGIIIWISTGIGLFFIFSQEGLAPVFLVLLLFLFVETIIVWNLYIRFKQANIEGKMLAAFSETNPDPVLAVSANGNILYANPGTYRVCQNFFGTDDLSVLIPPVVRKRLPLKENIVQIRYQFNRVAFEYNFIWLSQFNRYHGFLQEISHRMSYEKQLFNLAYFDPITQLPNRVMFEKKLEELLSDSKSYPSALALVDIDNLHRIISITGYKAAEEGIKHICHRWDEHLQATFDEQAPTIYRLSGGYFAVLFNGNTEHNSNQVHNWVHDIQALLNKPLEIANHQFYLTCCIGLVFISELQEKTRPVLMRYADMALMEAKSIGDNATSIFETKIEKKYLRRINIEHELHQAIINQEFFLHYQQKFDLKSNQVVGCEALLRWKAENNLMMPDDFMDIAEHSGLIVKLIPWLVEQACKAAVSVFKHCGHYIPVAINLSTQQFLSHTLVGTFQHFFEAYKIPGNAICIEVTETVALKNFNMAIKQLNNLNNMGITIALDDFGTGYYSLEYLQRLPIQLLKIERRFINELDKNKHNQVLVKAVITLAHQFGMKVVAEGVETEDEKKYLVKLGCDQVQGYLLGKPMILNEFIASMANRKFGT